jgi:hypothetical protein
MDKTHKNQENTSFESHLWEEVSDEAAAACVGGSNGELKSMIQGIMHHLLQIIGWGKAT